MGDQFIKEAKEEVKRRGIHGLGPLDISTLVRYREQGKTAVEAGAQLAMDIILNT